MVREFKKTGVATALTGALLAAASMSSHATVQLSAPGDVLLVPHVTCDVSAANPINTMVGIVTFYKERLGLLDPTVGYLPAPANVAGYGIAGSPALPSVSRSSTTRTLHWYFYDTQSVHILDGIIPVTDNDFVRFDWCGTLRSLSKLGDLGQGTTPGYMLFVDNNIDRNFPDPVTGYVGVPSFAIYGHSYLIAGNWATQAFIPVISNPVATYVPDPSLPGSTFTVNVTKRNGYPSIRRLVTGIDYTDTSGAPGVRQRDVYMRYFLDPSLAQSNDMVFWFNNNQPEVRASVPGETYDSEQNYQASFSWPLPQELNLIRTTPTVPKLPGMIHEEVETYGSKFTVVNTGVLRFGVPEVKSTVPYTSSGVAFNMLGLTPDPATQPVQLQTEMATEGADYTLF